MSGRKRADSKSVSTDSSPKTKGRGERLVNRGCDHATVGTSFVSGSHEISVALVETVSSKACLFYLTFKDTYLGNEYYYGQGGLIQGETLTVTPPDNDEQKKKRRASSRKVSFFSEYASFEATPVTAKHNLESCDNEQYLRTTVKFADGYETDITMPDGGCLLDGEAEIEVRAATQNCEVIVGTTSNCLPTSVPVLPILLRAILYFVQYLYSFLPIVRLFYLTRYLPS